jgi:hypothetical protein
MPSGSGINQVIGLVTIIRRDREGNLTPIFRLHVVKPVQFRE